LEIGRAAGDSSGNGTEAMHTSTPALAEPRRPHAGTLSQASIMHQSDERLVALARSGSERAWAEITRRYRRQLRSYCARFVGPSRAEDAVQQTFLQAFLALRDGQNREIALRAWLYRIAHNCSIDVLRKGSPDYDQLDLEYDGVPQPPMLFEQKEEIRGLVARMRSLPEAQRQALALRELEGRSYEEISARLGHSGSGVRQLIFRARTALRNGVAAIAPVGFLKGRLSQNVPFDCHHVASVAAPARRSRPDEEGRGGHEGGQVGRLLDRDGGRA
jgi:RNA polymerase sigma factor (sigma-70 family)